MGVTIDNLQIEIQSSSTNAARGIDALATSLEKLKKNGAFKTVSTNLNNLSNALKNLTNVYQASNSLRTLANSIEKLKSVGTVSSLSNSLGKLPSALKSLSGINLEKTKTQLEGIADAVSPLSSIKTGGFSSMVNSMKNLGKVTESLDDETIAKFAEKVDLLNQKLGPLSEKMTTIKAGFGAINSGARKAASGVKQLGDDVDASALNMTSFIEIIRTAVDVIQGLVQWFTEVTAQAVEWDGIAARFGRGFAGQASETYAWLQRLNEEMGINIQEFMKYSSVYSTMLTGFGVATEDAGKMALGYMELTYDIWAGYNDVYKSLEEAAEAVKSAIAGEVEPVRRAGFTIVESTLQQTAANHGLEISLEKATEAQKSYLRYLTLVDQAHAQNLVGTYAKEMNTAEGMLRTLAQQIKSLTQAFGSLFLPILVRVLPYFQAFVELATEAVYWLANLFGVDIQPVEWGGMEDGAGAIDSVTNSANGATGALDSATKAAKELKNATLGIDELNVISPSSASGASGGAGSGSGGAGGNGFEGLDVDSLWDESIFDTIQSKVDGIKEKLRGVFDDWLPALQIIGGALGAWTIAGLLDQLGEALKLTDKFEGAVKNIRKLAATAITIVLQFKLMEDAFGDFMSEDGTILDYIEGVLIGAVSTYLLYKMWGPAGLVIGLGVTAAVSLKTVIDAGGITDMESATVALTGLATSIAAIATAWNLLSKSKFIGDFGAFLSLAKEHGVIATLAATFPKLSSALSSVTGNLGAFISLAKEHGVVSTLAATFPKLSSAVTAVTGALKGIGAAIVAHPWVAVAVAVVAAIVGAIVLAIVDYDFTEIGYKIGQAIGNTIKSVVNFGKTIWESLQAGIDWVVATFGGLSWSEFWAKFVEVGKACLDGIVQGIKNGWNNFLGNIAEFINGFVQGFKDALGIHSPSTVFAEIGRNIIEGLKSTLGVNAIKDKLVSMWTAAKSWWDTQKSNLASYTPSIGNIASKLSSAWESAKTWWKDKRSSLSYTPSIGKIWEKLRDAWTNAKDWWKEKRSSLSYTPSIGSISTKLSSAWTTAKNWWNKNRSSLSYTPSIGSIKDKIVSAWNTAKKWWSSNAKLSTKLNVSVPKIKVQWDTASAFGKSFKYPTGFKLDFAANGGIFDQGSMIWAGERGAEIVANAAGGKTGVMNVQQMQEAVYEGVYAAVSAAMRGHNGGGSQSVNVYLDGKQITAAVEQRQHERGATIMGNEVYSY